MTELLILTARYFKNKIKNTLKKILDEINLANQFCNQLKLELSKCEIWTFSTMLSKKFVYNRRKEMHIEVKL